MDLPATYAIVIHLSGFPRCKRLPIGDAEQLRMLRELRDANPSDGTLVVLDLDAKGVPSVRPARHAPYMPLKLPPPLSPEVSDHLKSLARHVRGLVLKLEARKPPTLTEYMAEALSSLELGE